MGQLSLLSGLVIAGALAAGVTSVAAGAPAVAHLESSGPHCKPALDFPEWRSVWLGHFTGGGRVHEGGGVYGLAWRDEYACFPSRAACEGWLRRMRGAYRGVDGYRTCIVIRSGPMLQAPSSAFPLLRIFD
jgi:hypothetical protein